MKASTELLARLKEISRQINDLSDVPEQYELDADAIVDLNLARESVDKLVHRLERLIQ